MPVVFQVRWVGVTIQDRKILTRFFLGRLQINTFLKDEEVIILYVSCQQIHWKEQKHHATCYSIAWTMPFAPKAHTYLIWPYVGDNFQLNIDTHLCQRAGQRVWRSFKKHSIWGQHTNVQVRILEKANASWAGAAVTLETHKAMWKTQSLASNPLFS